MIFDGSSFGTATPAGSDEEADYLGIPGLLDADQMRDLLRRRQEEQLDRRSRVAGDIRSSAAADSRPRRMGSYANCAANSTRWCRSRTTAPGKPHGWIHNELRRLCGGPPIAAATRDQLQARIEAVRGLQS